jgi:cation:H+ antiporter
VGIAQVARISGAIIGATVAAFATSSPELAIAISSATAQRPQISLGDALGSNIVNVALILGVVLAISPVHSLWCAKIRVSRH